MSNNNSDTTTSYNELPKQFLNYINYELSFFEKIAANKKFLFNIFSNDQFELNVYELKEEDDNNKSNYRTIYRANNIYQFIKRLFMLREHLIKNFGNK